MIPYFHALFIQRHGMISALMIYGRFDTVSSCLIRGFQLNNVNPLNFIKMHLKCHKSSDALYLLTLLTKCNCRGKQC